MYNLKSQYMGEFDVAVCGGGIAGACAAISAARAGAKTILIERGGSLGGTLTEGFMPLILDADNKGGLVKELYDFLDGHGMTIAKRGARIDENGKRIPGRMLDTEGCKYFFDKASVDAGVTVLFHSQAAAVEMNGESIENLLVVTECGNYTLKADVYIDATGNGSLADYAGCAWDCGDPEEKRPSPTSMGVCTVGMPKDYWGTDSVADKDAYAKLLSDNGIEISAEQATVKILPSLNSWDMGMNFQYDVMPNDISSLSRAVLEGRRESFETIEAHKKISGYENLYTIFTSSHIGVREGRRIYGEYRLTDDDILEGRRFEDAVCLVTFGVDVHKLSDKDTTECARGYRTKPYHIPYRALLPKGCSNMILAGRCISGDFYPHASYRVMGNMAATGEAAGYAAAECSKSGTSVKKYDGKLVRDFMITRGYEI
ncbi:MAG: FAD-dependent oxidoreductase [Ruminococcaceae bacterium]|nr:FAD-dependent oxidoreductase [Oscillospiraceae bacterium]